MNDGKKSKKRSYLIFAAFVLVLPFVIWPFGSGYRSRLDQSLSHNSRHLSNGQKPTLRFDVLFNDFKIVEGSQFSYSQTTGTTYDCLFVEPVFEKNLSQPDNETPGSDLILVCAQRYSNARSLEETINSSKLYGAYYPEGFKIAASITARLKEEFPDRSWNNVRLVGRRNFGLSRLLVFGCVSLCFCCSVLVMTFLIHESLKDIGGKTDRNKLWKDLLNPNHSSNLEEHKIALEDFEQGASIMPMEEFSPDWGAANNSSHRPSLTMRIFKYMVTLVLFCLIHTGVRQLLCTSTLIGTASIWLVPLWHYGGMLLLYPAANIISPIFPPKFEVQKSRLECKLLFRTPFGEYHRHVLQELGFQHVGNFSHSGYGAAFPVYLSPLKTLQVSLNLNTVSVRSVIGDNVLVETSSTSIQSSHLDCSNEKFRHTVVADGDFCKLLESHRQLVAANSSATRLTLRNWDVDKTLQTLNWFGNIKLDSGQAALRRWWKFH